MNKRIKLLQRIRNFRLWFHFAVGVAIIVIALRILVGVGASTIEAGKWAGDKIVQTGNYIEDSWKGMKQEKQWKKLIKSNNQYVEQGCETDGWYRATLGDSTEAECRARAYRDMRYKLLEDCQKKNQLRRHFTQGLGNSYSVYQDSCIPKTRLYLTTPLTRDDYPFMDRNW